ncbi:hypothetical protein VCRA2110O182_20294 [Vibrio crassostreae]|nr:hypothetical protein VCRA2110O182_20294 [Vibrio crassostreae]CAK2326033.1 hypothetical protein VCRA2111O408_20294 [Vibrio crassostreae]
MLYGACIFNKCRLFLFLNLNNIRIIIAIDRIEKKISSYFVKLKSLIKLKRYKKARFLAQDIYE